jgi:hypothetical protein
MEVMHMRWILALVVLAVGCGVEKPTARPSLPTIPDVKPVRSPLEQAKLPDFSLTTSRIAPGPSKLTGPFGMQSFLACNCTWRGVTNWKFNKDNTFAVWIEGPLDRDLDKITSIPIPAGETRLTGRWEATKTELTLTDVTTGSGKPVEPFVLDLEWVDGKVLIDIAGFRYSKSTI